MVTHTVIARHLPCMDAVAGDRYGADRVTGSDHKGREHSGLEFMLRIADLGAHQEPMGVGSTDSPMVESFPSNTRPG